METICQRTSCVHTRNVLVAAAPAPRHAARIRDCPTARPTAGGAARRRMRQGTSAAAGEGARRSARARSLACALACAPHAPEPLGSVAPFPPSGAAKVRVSSGAPVVPSSTHSARAAMANSSRRAAPTRPPRAAPRRAPPLPRPRPRPRQRQQLLGATTCGSCEAARGAPGTDGASTSALALPRSTWHNVVPVWSKRLREVKLSRLPS